MGAGFHLAVVAVLATAALVTGQLVGRALGLRRLRRLDSCAVALTAVFGAVLWTVGFSVLTATVRLPARPALLGLLGVHALLVLAAARRGTLGVPRPRGATADWLVLATALALTTVLGLLPVLLHGGFLAGNDTHTYCALAEWLQRYGFGEPVSWPPQGPPDEIVALHQRTGRPLAAGYPLALARAAGLAPSTLALYPAASTLGLLLIVCAAWWTMRGALRLARPVAGVALLLLALAPHAAYWAHHNGFLSQTHAVPALLVGLAALVAPRGVHGRLGLVGFSLAAAFLYVAYLPFLVLLGAAALVEAATALGRRGSGGTEAGRVFRRWSMVVATVAVLVGLDYRPLLRGVPALLKSTDVGAHVPLGPIGFAATALGVGPGAAAGVPRTLEPGTSLLVLPAGLLALVGGAALWRHPRGRGVLAVTVVVVALGLGYAWLGRDPWTSERGHTWLVFKAVQWTFPLAALLQAAGLGWLRRHRVDLAPVALAAAIAMAPAHLPWSRDLGHGLDDILPGGRPLERLGRVLDGLRTLPPGRLVLLGLPERPSSFRAMYAALLVWPRPVGRDWDGDSSTVPVLADAPPFDEQDRRDLGGGFALLEDVDRPRLVQVVAPVRWERPAGSAAPVAPLAPPRVKLVVLAPAPGSVGIRLEAEPPDGLTTAPIRLQVVPGHAGGWAFRRALREAPERWLEVARGRALTASVDLPRGESAVVLSPAGAASRVTGLTLAAGTAAVERLGPPDERHRPDAPGR